MSETVPRGASVRDSILHTLYIYGLKPLYGLGAHPSHIKLYFVITNAKLLEAA